MAASTLSQLTGKLQLRPGAPQPLVCTRPLASASGLRRLVAGREPSSLPGLLGSLFTLCGEQHRLTAQCALDVARGRTLTLDGPARQERALRSACLREHIVHIALHWCDPDRPERAWLCGLPERSRALAALVAFAQERVLGSSAQEFLARGPSNSASVSRWAAAHSSRLPAAAWLERVREPASALRLALRPECILDDVDASLPLLAAAMRHDEQFCEHASHDGRPAETGPFNRAARPRAERACRHVYDLLAARVLDIVQLCQPQPYLRCGALALAPGEAIAYSELSRGVLLHWVKLTAAANQVADYRIVTPTDFCLHPEGALATRLRTPGLDAHDVRLVLAAFDPCLEIEPCTS